MSYGNISPECNKSESLKSGPSYPSYPEDHEAVKKNNFNKKIQRSSQKFEVLNTSLKLIQEKLLLSSRNDETLKQDAIDEFERYIKYCKNYKDELQSAINNDVMEEVVK